MDRDMASIRVNARTYAEAEEAASRAFAVYFSGFKWEFVNTWARAYVTVGGDVLTWEIDAEAERK